MRETDIVLVRRQQTQQMTIEVRQAARSAPAPFAPGRIHARIARGVKVAAIHGQHIHTFALRRQAANPLAGEAQDGVALIRHQVEKQQAHS